MGKVERIRELLLDPFAGFNSLTDTERQVLRLASRGLTYRLIADQEDMTKELVAYYMRSGLLKIGMEKKEIQNMVINRIEAIVGD